MSRYRNLWCNNLLPSGNLDLPLHRNLSHMGDGDPLLDVLSDDLGDGHSLSHRPVLDHFLGVGNGYLLFHHPVNENS